MRSKTDIIGTESILNLLFLMINSLVLVCVFYFLILVLVNRETRLFKIVLSLILSGSIVISITSEILIIKKHLKLEKMEQRLKKKLGDDIYDTERKILP